MTDRRDTDPELARMLSELEETLTELRGRLDEGETGRFDQMSPGHRRDAGRREGPPLPRPPGMREILRFTEQQTIPTLVAILEANIRLLRLAGAALRAVDPERSAVEPGEESAVSRALDAGGRLSTDRLSTGLEELQSALSGTEATNPEARQLLEDAERLSEEVRARIRETEGGMRSVGGGAAAGATEPATGDSSGPVRIEVEDATESDDEEVAGDDETDSGVDVDAELDSIREEVRTEADDGTDAESGGDEDSPDADSAGDDDHDAETRESDASDGGGGSLSSDERADESTDGDEPADGD